MTPRCGTLSGYQAHRRRDEDACRPCKAAQADYQRTYNRARSRALTRLAHVFPIEFQALLLEEQQREAAS